MQRKSYRKTIRRLALAFSLSLVCGLFISCSPEPKNDQAVKRAVEPKAEDSTAAPAITSTAPTNIPPTNVAAVAATTNIAAPPTNAAASATNAVVSRPPNQPPGAPTPPGGGAAAPLSDMSTNTEPIQLSFQGANIDTIVQWLAKTTGKSVVKHPKVQCQLTIVSSKKTTPREAINLVYRALALEAFTTIESSTSILIVPEGQEPKLSPELLETTQNVMPDGRQRLVRVFQIKHVPPSELKERVKLLLSEKGTIDADDRGNKLIVTDYTDNIRLLNDLLPELDVASAADSVLQIYTLKHLEAEELANLLSLVLNERAGTPARVSKPTSSYSPSSSSSPFSPFSSGSSRSISSSSSSPPPPSPSPSTPTPAGDQLVKLWPDKNSNRLIVSAPRSKIPEIEKLIEVLDTAKPADVAIRVLPMRHVNAVDLVRDMAPVYQKMSGQSLKDTIEITANERANALIILSSEVNFEAIKKLVASLDTEEAQEKVLETFPLQNADAEEVAEQLRQLTQEKDTMSRFIYYYPPQPSRGPKVSVVADRRRNTVIIQAPPSVMAGITEMIKALDEPVSDDSLAPKIYALKFVNAADIVDVLNELFLKKQTQRSYWSPYGDFGQTGDKDPNVGRLYGKVRITSEPYANAIIVTANSPENLAAVDEILKQLDVPSQAGESTIRVGLKFAEAVALANSLNILFARGGSPPLRAVPQQNQPQDNRNPQQNQSSSQSGFQLEQEKKEETYYPWLGGQPENARGPDGTTSLRPASELVGRVRVVPDTRSNGILITGNIHFLPQVLKLIGDLDAPTAQVLIEAKIIEVSSDFRDRLGVRFSPDGSQVFDADDLDGSLQPSVGVEYMRLLGGSGANKLNSGVLDASVNLDILIQFLRKNTDATVLAQPQINVSDNELGKLFVGSQVPFISASLNTPEGGRNDSFQYKDVGIILEVTPHINNSEEVALKIHAESSNIRSGQTLFGGAILDTRNFHTDLLVKGGQTVVLGGIIQREEANTIRKVPLLGSIPGLGWAFKKKDKVSRNVELMVFLRPRITRTPEEALQLLQEVEDKTPKLRQFKESETQQLKK